MEFKEKPFKQKQIFEADKDGFVNFGDVSRQLMGIQCQYGSRYIDGVIEGYPNLSEGLRFIGKPENYHSVKIHKDDIDEFIKRYREYLKQRLEKKF